jgi:hypothetical protein
MEKISKNLFFGLYTSSLLSSVINGTEPKPLPEGLDLEELYIYQVHQSVANMAYCALSKLDVPAKELQVFAEEYKMMLLREARFELSGQQVFDALEKTKIPYIPLKGVIIKRLYPQESLRSFTDYDIYIGDKGKQVKAVMESLGFEEKVTAEYDVAYFKKPSLYFEMHNNLFEEDYSFDGYFDKPFEKTYVKSGTEYCHLLKNEDFFIHVFCHLYKHFTFGGCGVRQFMDIYVLMKHWTIDYTYVTAELEKLGLVDFFNTVKKVNGVIFDGEKPNKDLLDICEYIFSNGTFGTDKIIAVNDFNKKKESMLLWKMKHFAKRWVLSYSRMKERYAILEKMPFLLPFCWAHKAFKVLFFKRDVLKSQLTDIEEYNSDYSSYLKHIREISGVKK